MIVELEFTSCSAESWNLFCGQEKYPDLFSLNKSSEIGLDAKGFSSNNLESIDCKSIIGN